MPEGDSYQRERLTEYLRTLFQTLVISLPNTEYDLIPLVNGNVLLEVKGVHSAGITNAIMNALVDAQIANPVLQNTDQTKTSSLELKILTIK